MPEDPQSAHKARIPAEVLDSSRQSFPEPTLLAHIAGSVPLPQLPRLMAAVTGVSSDHVAFPSSSQLLAACCNKVAERMRDTDEKTLTLLLNDYPILYSYLNASELEVAISAALAMTDSQQAGDCTERLCRLAACHPDYKGGLLIDLALAEFIDLPLEHRAPASAWFLAVAKDAERDLIVDHWMISQWDDVESVTALFNAANEAELERLSTRLLTLHSEGAEAALVVAILAELLPVLRDVNRSGAIDQLSLLLPTVIRSQPAWWSALICSRICSIESSFDLKLDGLDQPWHDWAMSSFNHRLADTPYADVLRAHPGAITWMQLEDYPRLTPEEAATLLEQIVLKWGQMEVAMAPVFETAIEPPAPPSPRASVPPPVAAPAPAPERVTRRAATSSSEGIIGRVVGGLGGLLGGVLSTRSSSTSSGNESVMRGPQTSPQPVTRHLQADVLLTEQNKQLKHAFIAGKQHTINLSVGHEGSLQVAAPFQEPEFAPNTSSESLEIRLIHNLTVSAGSIRLDKDRNSNSSVWPAVLTVPEDAEDIQATVVVLHKDRTLQTATLSGRVVATVDLETTSDSEITFAVTADVHGFSHLVEREPFDASVVITDESSAAFSGSSMGVRDLKGVDKTIQKMTELLFKKSEALAISGAANDPVAYQQLLVRLAVKGKALHSVLIKQLMPSLDQAQRIQIVSTNPSAILPLEFVYSGPSLQATATLCTNWQQALARGHCPDCQNQPDDQRSDSICPLHFWALSKIIERHAPGKPRASGHDFFVSSQGASARKQLAPLSNALFAASDNVPEDLVDSTLAVLTETVSSCSDARTWSDWASNIASNSPSLLVSMPHNALDPMLDISTLEIGNGDDLRSGEVTRKMVCTDTAQVGPVVVLLGCQTAVDAEQPFLTFVSEFRHNGASVVIGTLATVLAEHAAPVVQAIVRELTKPAASNENTIGDILLRVRRQMFAQGILIALAVTSFGDADWVLTATTDETGGLTR